MTKPEDYFHTFSVPTTAKVMAEREKRIKDILSRGKIVRFTFSGNPAITKDVNEWSVDQEDDLKAFRISAAARTPYVCWASPLYLISEVEPDSN